MSNDLDNILSERMLREAIDQLSRQNDRQRREAERQNNMAYFDPNMMRGMRYGTYSDIPSPYGSPERKRLKLEFEGHEIYLQTDVPSGMPPELWARQFGEQVYRILREFPRNWSRVGEGRPDNSQNDEQPEPDPDINRFGAAFE